MGDGPLSAFKAVYQQSQESGLAVYLVGGPVRDALLGFPLMDLDFSVEGDAVGLARHIAKRTDGELTVHPRFETASVTWSQVRVDLVTARSETYPGPGQLPVITPGTIGDDLARRDFTINAMALPLSRKGPGILDPFGGLTDLAEGIIRALHIDSFRDDPTRMLRAVRYEQRFGFGIDAKYLARMGAAVSMGHMDAVSGDRWRRELEKILEEPAPGVALARATQLGLLGGIHPAWRDYPGLPHLAGLGGDAWDRNDWLAALFNHLAPEEGDAVIDRLRLSGRDTELARGTMLLRNAEVDVLNAASRPSSLYRLLSVFDAAAVSSRAKLTRDPTVSRLLQEYSEDLRHVRPEITGEKLLDMGVPKGPSVGRILERLREARMDGLVSNEEDEVALAYEMLALDQGTGAK